MKEKYGSHFWKWSLCLMSGLTILFGNFKLTSIYGQESTEIKVYLNESKIISVNKPKRVAIGNPDTVDVISVSDDILILSPKARGMTNLMVWDGSGIHSYRIKVVGGDVQEIKIRVDEILEELHLVNVQTKISEDDGRVFLFGEVRGDQDKELLNSALGSLKSKVTNLIRVREEDVVEIEAQLIELTKDGTKSLGFSWPGSITFTERGSSAISDTGSKMGTLFKVLNYSRDQFNFTLDALIQENKARVLSKPRLACLSGKEAQLLVGGEKPIFTTEVVSTTGGSGVTGTGVSYKEYGIKLKIKPVVLENNKINLMLKLEVSEPGTVESIGGTNATARAYPFTKREVITELSLNDGQTLGIGGLIKQKLEDEIRKTPFLSDIPVLGILFKKKLSRSGGGFGEKGDAELFIILTPKIVSEKEASGKGIVSNPIVSSESEPIKPVYTPKEESIVSDSEKGRQEYGPSVGIGGNKNIPDVVKRDIMEKAVYSNIAAPQAIKQVSSGEESAPAGGERQVEPVLAAAKEPVKESIAPMSPAPAGEIKNSVTPEPVKNEFIEGIPADEKETFDKQSVDSVKKEKAINLAVNKAKKELAKKEKKRLVSQTSKEINIDSPKMGDSSNKDLYPEIDSLSSFDRNKNIPDAVKKDIMEKAVYSNIAAPRVIKQVSSGEESAPAGGERQVEPVLAAEKEEPVKESIAPMESAPAGETTGSDSIVQYANSIRKTILEKLSYPALARQRNIQGRVKLRLHISSSGELLESFVKESSTYEILDYNTLSIAKNIIQYPPFPSSIHMDDLWLEIPIDYITDQK